MSFVNLNKVRVFNTKRFHLIAFLLIAVMILIAYSNTFTAAFHFDDDAQIAENPFIKQMTWDNVVVQLKSSRPVVGLSLMLNYQLGGLNVVGWHIFNIAVHILNSMFVYLFIFKTLNLPLFQKRFSETAAIMALFVSLLFAVHPVQTESVTYIISRSELLTAFFYLATFLLFIRYVETARFRYVLAALFTSACAMGSKQWAVTLPVMLFLYDYLFLSAGDVRKALSRGTAYILIALPVSYILSFTDLSGSTAGSSYGVNIESTGGVNSKTFLLTSFNVLWTYIRLLFLPINQNLDYDYPIAKTLVEFPTFISFLGHLALAGGAFWLFLKKRQLLIPFGIAWFYITISPVQSFVPIIDVIFEHRLYLPSIGFFLVFVVLYQYFFDWIEQRNAAKKPIRDQRGKEPNRA